MRPMDWRALAGAGLGLLVLAGALWPAPAPRAIPWRVRIAQEEMGLARAAPVPVAVPTLALTVSATPASARPAVAPPVADHRLDRPPSLSAAHIDAVLAAYGSPATGLGATFYDQGLAAGIDPAYLLAFFIVESQAGTRGVARQTHALGNIRCTPGYACIEGYRAYARWSEGSADWYALLRTLYLDTWGLHTPAAILPRYAPAGDGNDPVAYAAQVIALVDGWAGR